MFGTEEVGENEEGSDDVGLKRERERETVRREMEGEGERESRAQRDSTYEN